jgi:hypothetical protein
MFNNPLSFRKSCHLWHNVAKYCRVGQTTDDNMAYARCMLRSYGYKHTLRTGNGYCFATTTVVARIRLSDALYVHWLSCKCGTHEIKFFLLFPRVFQGSNCRIVLEGPDFVNITAWSVNLRAKYCFFQTQKCDIWLKNPGWFQCAATGFSMNLIIHVHEIPNKRFLRGVVPVQTDNVPFASSSSPSRMFLT